MSQFWKFDFIFSKITQKPRFLEFKWVQQETIQILNIVLPLLQIRL